MKRLFKAIIVALCFCTLLTGCKDATATVSNPNELIVQVGKEKVTKKDLYDRMMTDDATNSIISKAMEIITAAEIETTPALEAKAQELFESYKAQMETQGDFEEVLKDFIQCYYLNKLQNQKNLLTLPSQNLNFLSKEDIKS